MKLPTCIALAAVLWLPQGALAQQPGQGARPAPAAAVKPVPAAAPPATAKPAAPGPAASVARQSGSSRTVDRLELERTTIKGSQELPRVMYVVPWKRADLGDLTGKPPNSLLDEILGPVDRDEFRREVAYHAAIDPDRVAAPPQ
jgi:hypothetical protein